LKRLDFLGAPLREVSHSQDLKFEPIVEKEGILREAVTNFEREYILKKLEMNHWHRTKVAYELGIDRKTLFKKMRNYGIFVPHNGAK
jgi:DNA-binding NtrC family response regulator